MSKQLNVNLAFTADTSKAKAEINSLQQSLAKISSGVGLTGMGSQMTAGLQEASQAAIQLQAHLQKAVNVNTGTLNFTAFNQSVKSSGTSVQALGESLLKAGSVGQQSFAQLTTAIAKSEVPLTRMGTTFAKFGQTLKNTISWQISSSMIHGFIGAIQGAYGYAKDLNESLNNIRIVTGQSADQMARFAEQANKTAKQLSTTTTKYTNASLIYYQQGLNDQEVKARTDVTMKLANAAGISAEAASTQLTAIWNNFDNGSQSLEHYADVLVKLGAETASSSEEISQGMQKFASVAETVGLSYEYAAAALATVTATTRQSADTVGTAFKTLFARLEGLQLGETLEDGTDLNKYSKALATVGVNIKDTSGEIKNMDTILDELGAKWKNLGKDQQIALAQTVGGMRQYTQLVALMDNWDFFKENVNRAQNADGTLQKQQEIYAESWEAAANRVKAANQAIIQDLLKDKAFIGILNTLEDLLTGIDNFIDGLGGIRGVLLSIGAIATTVFGKKLASGLTTVGQGIKTMFMGPAGIQAEKMKVFNGLQESFTGVVGDSSFASLAQQSVYKSQFASQTAYMQNAKNLSPMAQLAAKIAMDAQQQTGAEKIEAAKQQDIATRNMGAIRLSMMEGASGHQFAQHEGAINTNLTAQHALEKAAQGGYTDPKSRYDLYKKLKAAGIKDRNVLKDVLAAAKAPDAGKSTEILGKTLGELKESNENNYTSAGVAKNKREGYGTAFKGVLAAKDNYGDKSAEHANAKANLQKILDDAKKGPTGTEKMVSAASAVMSLGMAISSAKGIMDAWDNSDLSIGEKLTTTATSGGMAVMMLASSFQSLQASFTWMTGGMFAGIIAGVTALVVVFDQLSKAYNADAIAAERAMEASKNLTNKQQEAEQKLKDIKQTFSEYDTLVSKLNSCAKGTEEWRDSLTDVNELMLNILNKNPEFSEYIKKNSDGVYEISKADQNTIIEEQEKQAKHAQYAASLGKLSAQEAQLEADQTDVIRKYSQTTRRDIESEQYFDATKYVLNAEKYAQMEAKDFAKELEETAFTGNVEEFQNSLKELAAATTNIANQIKIASDLIVEQELGNKFGDGAKAIASQAYGTEADRLEDEYLSKIKKLGRNAKRDDEDVKEIWDKYNKALGTDYKLASNAVIGDKHSRSFQYIGENEVQEIDAESVASVIGAFEALEKMTNSATKASEMISGLDSVGKDELTDYIARGDFGNATSKELAEMEREYSSFKQMSAEGFEITENNLTDFVNSLKEETGFDAQAIADATGQDVKDVVQTLVDQFLNQKEAFATIGENFSTKVFDSFNSLQLDTKDLSFNQQLGIGEILQNAFNASGTEGLEAMTAYLSEAFALLGNNTAGIEEFVSFLLGIDWSSATPEILSSKIEELAGVCPSAAGALGGVIDKIRELLNLGQGVSKDEAQAMYRGVTDIVNSLSSDNRILAEDKYQELAKWAGGEDAISKYFQERADGSYSLTGLYEDFAADMQQIALQGFQSTIDGATAKNANISQFAFKNNNISGKEYADKFFDGGIGSASQADLLGFIQARDPNAAANLLKQYEADTPGKIPSIPKDVLHDAVYQALYPTVKQAFDTMVASGDYEKSFAEFVGEQVAVQNDQSWDQLSANALGMTDEQFSEAVKEDGSSLVGENDSFDSDLALDQLQFLKAAGVEAFSDGEGIEDYISKVQDGTLSLFEYQEVLNKVGETGSEVYSGMIDSIATNNEQVLEFVELQASTAETTSELWEMLNQQMAEGNISADEAQQIYSNVLDTVLQTELADWNIPYEDVLKRAEAMSKLEKYQDNSLDQLKEMAAEIEEDAKAVEDLTDNQDSYKKALDEVVDAQKKNKQASSASLKETEKAKKSISKLVNIPVKNLSNEMAKAAMESKHFQKALDGDEKAMHALIGEMNDMGAYKDLFTEALGENATEEALGEMQSKFGEVNDYIQGELDKGLTAGEIDLSSMEGSLNEMLAMCGSNVEAAKGILAALGISAELEPAEPTTQTVQHWAGEDVQAGESSTHTLDDCSEHTHYGIKISDNGINEQTLTNDPPPSWKIKDGTGEVISAPPSKGGGGGGGGGGGKAKPPKPLKRIKPQVRYEGTKKRIDNLSKQQDQIAAKKETAFGKARIKNIEQEIELKQRQIKLQTQYMEETKEALELQKIDVADRLKKFTGIEIEFDVDGSVSNLDKVEEAILDLENHIIRLQNAEADEFTIAYWEEILDMAREGFDDLLDIIEANLEAENEFFAAINELNELVLEGIQYKVELDISIDEAEVEYIDYMLEKLSDEGFDAAESIMILGDKAGNALRQIEVYRKGISDILATRGISVSDLINMDADDLMGLGFGEAEIEALLEYRSAIIENMGTLNELRNEMVEKVSGAFSVFSDELSRQIDLFEHYSGLLEHFGEIATLTGSRFAKSELKELFSSMDNAAMANGQANIKAAKARLESVQAMYNEFMATYDEATASQVEREAKAEMEDALNEAQEDFYATWEDTLSKATEILERWVEDAGARFEEALSPMYQSLDRLEEAYERMKEQDENYYDNYEQLYHLSQLTRDISNSIDDTDNIKGKQRLRDLMKEITDIQARGVELSEYDVDILRKRYELEQARQALEDASDNASLVRLQRDQEGNWGYVYTADEDAVDEAEKEYENKLYELQKANDEYIKELQDRILELTTNCKEQLADIAADTTLSPEEKEKLSQEVADFYNSQLEYLTSQMDGALANQNATLGLMLSVYDTTKDQLLDTWGETNLSLLGMYNSTGEMFAGLTGSMKGYMNDLWEGILNFDNNLNNTNIAAGGKDAFEALANEIGKIGINSESTKESVIALGESFKQEFSEIIDSVTKFENTYDAAIDEAINKNEELVMSLLDVISTLALVNSDDQAFTDAYNKYRAAQQKYLEGLDDTVDIGQIRYGLLETENEEWEAAKKEFEEFMREWMTQRSGGITDSGQSYDTGGYTGDWGPERRLAWLHQKEIVLNAADTENLLDAVAMVRELELNVGTFTDRLSEIVPSIISMGHEAFQQEIYITAEFPDATSAAEIQEAFENLINDAAQYAYSR